MALQRQLLLILIFLTILIAFVLVNQPKIETTEIGATGTIQLRSIGIPGIFQSAVLKVSPDVAGTWQITGNNAIFSPQKALSPGEKYFIEFQPQGLWQLVTWRRSWQVRVRTALVAVIKNPNTTPEIFAYSPKEGVPIQITFTNGNVNDYAVSRDGNMLAVVIHNEFGGSDIALLSRPNWSMNTLIECRSVTCNEPAWSPDGEWIAYSRKDDAGAAVWTARVDSGETTRLSMTNPGGMPIWSPNGRYLSFFNASRSEIEVIDTQTMQWQVVSTSIPQKPVWSPDSSGFLVLRSFAGEGQPYVNLVFVDLLQQTSDFAFADDLASTDYGQPAWHPDGEWIAVPRRLITNVVTKQIGVLRIDGSGDTTLTTPSAYTYARLSWNPIGEELLYQRFAVGTSDAVPEVGILDFPEGNELLLISDAALPSWLP